MDPLGVVLEILSTAFPAATVDEYRAAPLTRAIGAKPDHPHILCQVAGSSGRRLRQTVQADVQVVVYHYGDRASATEFAWAVGRALYDAVADGQVTEFGHLQAIQTPVSPYQQDLPGIPDSIRRMSATYSVIARPPAT